MTHHVQLFSPLYFQLLPPHPIILKMPLHLSKILTFGKNLLKKKLKKKKDKTAWHKGAAALQFPLEFLKRQ